MHLSGPEKVGVGLALVLGLGGGIAVAFPNKLVGYAIMVFCLLGRFSLVYHHFLPTLPDR